MSEPSSETRFAAIEVDQPFAGHALLRARPVAGVSWEQTRPDVAALVESELSTAGALLLRDFDANRQRFREIAGLLGEDFLSYRYGSTPRTHLGEGIYTATEYPKDRSIPFHNEQSYTKSWPKVLCFCCLVPAESGGETPIADSRAVYARLSPKLQQAFEDKGVMYVRNYRPGIDLSWQEVFGTDDPAQVEAYCRRARIQYEWMDDGTLRTREVCQGVACHPVSGDKVWFNQATLFHPWSLPADAREALETVFEPHEMPRNAFYGDGSPIEEAALEEINGVYDEMALDHGWQGGDVLILDNMLWAHSRQPYSGARDVVVAMLGQSDADQCAD